MNCLVVLNHPDSTGPNLGRKHLLRRGRPEPLPLTGWDIRQILGGPMVTSLEEIAEREGCSKRHVERTLSNAFLAPQIIKAAVDGHLPRGVNAKALVDAPVEWTQQWHALGLQEG